MKFTSTRSDVEVDSLHTVLRGLAADGGLYVPARVPCLDTSAISSMRSFWGLSPPQFGVCPHRSFLQAKDVQFLQRGRSEAHEGARSWKPHRVRGGDGGEGLRTPAASQSRRRRESGMTVSHEWLDKVFWLPPLTRYILAPPREINPHSPTSHRPPSGYLFFSELFCDDS